jgi:K+-sensing histidine kinase KdpD
LIGLVSGLDVIGKWSKDLTPKQFAELMEIAHVSVERLQDQIEDILHYTRLPVLSNKSTRFSLAELPRLIGRIAMDVEIDTISLTGPEELGDCLIMPSTKMMELVLYELFENARKFHPENMPEIDVHVSRQEKMVKITVTDNGRFLAPDQLEEVWTPYYQAEKSFTGEIPGMGLGLPVIASLIWQVNGQCRLYNRPDKPGITAELLLPLDPNYTQTQPAHVTDLAEMDAPSTPLVTTRII